GKARENEVFAGRFWGGTRPVLRVPLRCLSARNPGGPKGSRHRPRRPSCPGLQQTPTPESACPLAVVEQSLQPAAGTIAAVQLPPPFPERPAPLFYPPPRR